MSGMRMDMGMVMRPDLKTVLTPRMIQSMEILQLTIVDLQAKIDEALQENPFLELKEKHGEQDEQQVADFNPDAPLKHDETGDLEFNRLEELNRDWDDHFNEEHRGSRAALEEEGDRKLDAMANMPDRPPSLQDHLAEQLGEMELDEEQMKLAKHICTFIDRTGYLGVGSRSARTRARGIAPNTLPMTTSAPRKRGPRTRTTRSSTATCSDTFRCPKSRRSTTLRSAPTRWKTASSTSCRSWSRPGSVPAT